MYFVNTILREERVQVLLSEKERSEIKEKSRNQISISTWKDQMQHFVMQNISDFHHADLKINQLKPVNISQMN